MHITNIRKLRRFIAKLPPQACNMSTWDSFDDIFTSQKRHFDCGSAACIGGWDELMQRLAKGPEYPAADHLGLTTSQKCTLFYVFPGSHVDAINWKEWMIARLDDVIKTRQVRQWQRVKTLPDLIERAVRKRSVCK